MPTYSGYTPLRQTSTLSAPARSGTIDADVLVANSPDDSISELCFSPQTNHLAVSSWDKYVRVYDHTQVQAGTGIASMTFDGPVLSCHFSTDGQSVVGAGVDKTARLIDLAANGTPARQIAVHDAGIKSVRFFDAPQSNSPMVATASWDKTVRYWDLRSSNPAATVTLPDKIYSMDVKGHNLFAIDAQNKTHHIDLNNPAVFTTIENKVKRQGRAIISMARDKGYALATIEARCEINYMDPKKTDKSFTFRCHRSQVGNSSNYNLYPVNAISEHPKIPGVYSTAGADGIFYFWDIDRRARLRTFPSVGHAISATAFNYDGSLFAYAISYDWSKGHASHTPDYPHKVMIHPVGDECKTEGK